MHIKWTETRGRRQRQALTFELDIQLCIRSKNMWSQNSLTRHFFRWYHNSWEISLQKRYHYYKNIKRSRRTNQEKRRPKRGKQKRRTKENHQEEAPKQFKDNASPSGFLPGDFLTWNNPIAVSSAGTNVGRSFQTDRAEHDHQEPVHNQQRGWVLPSQGDGGGEGNVQACCRGGWTCHQQSCPCTPSQGLHLLQYVVDLRLLAPKHTQFIPSTFSTTMLHR